MTDVEETEYLALVLGEPSPDEPVLVRVQTASVMRDVFGVSADPDVLPATVPLRMIEDEGKGILLYVLPRGRASLVDDFQAALALGPSGETRDAAQRNAPSGAAGVFDERDQGGDVDVLEDGFDDEVDVAGGQQRVAVVQVDPLALH